MKHLILIFWFGIAGVCSVSAGSDILEPSFFDYCYAPHDEAISCSRMLDRAVGVFFAESLSLQERGTPQSNPLHTTGHAKGLEKETFNGVSTGVVDGLLV